MTGSAYQIIGYDCGWGAGDYGCEDGPEALDFPVLGARKLALRKNFKNKFECLPHLKQSLQLLKNAVTASLEAGAHPVVIGGDHTSAIATWAAVTDFYGMQGDFGLLWIDAHMDSHTLQTSNEGKWGGWWHGMSVATLAGEEHETFRDITNGEIKVNPKDMAIAGLRSFEPSEEKFRARHNIKSFADGSGLIESITHISRQGKGFGVSIDMDAFDPAEAPGVGSPEATGLKASDVLKAIEGIGHHPKFCGLEIVEFNPHNDEGDKTKKLVYRLIDAVFSSPPL